jgi:hypothetical protein
MKVKYLSVFKFFNLLDQFWGGKAAITKLHMFNMPIKSLLVGWVFGHFICPVPGSVNCHGYRLALERSLRKSF